MHGGIRDLSDQFTRDAKHTPDLGKGLDLDSIQAEPQADHLPLSLGEPGEQGRYLSGMDLVLFRVQERFIMGRQALIGDHLSERDVVMGTDRYIQAGYFTAGSTHQLDGAHVQPHSESNLLRAGIMSLFLKEVLMNSGHMGEMV
jgi:hypothetical protein